MTTFAFNKVIIRHSNKYIWLFIYKCYKVKTKPTIATTKISPINLNSLDFSFKLLFCVLSWASQILAHIHLEWQTLIQFCETSEVPLKI